MSISTVITERRLPVEGERRVWKWMRLTFIAMANIDTKTTRKRIKEAAAKYKWGADHLKGAMELSRHGQIWANEKYQVMLYPECEVDGQRRNSSMVQVPMTHLSIKLHTKKSIHDWRDLWAIKNCLVGEEHDAAEIYPAKSRLVDMANQYHLYVIDEPGLYLPFGMSGGTYMNNNEMDSQSLGIEQRALPKGHSMEDDK